MRKPLSQIPLEFGGEEKDPSPAPDGNGSVSQREGQYLSTAGVGIRVKAFKKPALPEADGDLFEAAPPAEETGSLAETSPAAIGATPTATIATTDTTATIATTAASTATAADTIAAKPATRRKPAVKTGTSKRGRKSLKQATAEADLIEIPADEVLFSKQYYTMGEVSEMFKVNQSLLRYWETEFDILQPRKNKKGDRYFRPVDIKNLHLIYHLLRQKKYTIEGAKDFLRNNKKAKERFEIIERLQQIRNFLLEWKAQL
jgi:DNA-binding transcriptional MerR regulator